MKSEFTSSWKASVQPRKQRKYVYNAPLHVRRRFLSAHLSPDLRKRHGKRSVPIKKGDEVLIMRGNLAGKQGKILSVSLKNGRVTIENINRSKKDGTKVNVYVHPSKIKIISLNTEDAKRFRKGKNAEKSDKKEKENAPNKS